MIVDSFENWKHYNFGPEWGLILEFINSLSPESEDGKYEFEGNDICANVMTYNTKHKEDTVVETHNEYFDVQFLLKGRETLGWTSAAQLEVKTPYDDGNDVTFFEHPAEHESSVTLRPGIFTLLFPYDDAHSPQGIAGFESEEVKKVVVKIHKSVLSY